MSRLATSLRLAFALSGAALLAHAPSHAAPAARAARVGPGPGAFTIEHALTLRSYGSLTWSRDGSKLAFTVSEPDTAENTPNVDLWLADFRAGGEPRRLTRHPKADVSPTFSPGGDTLAFVASRGTGEDAKSAIWMMSLRGGDPWAFGSYPEGVGEVTWSPDGRYLAWTMNDTLSRAAKEWRKKKWDQVVENERLQWPRLWVTEVATGKQRQLTGGELWLWNVRWSPDSKTLAFITSPSGKPDDGNRQDIGLVPVEGGPVRSLGVIGGGFSWSPDSRAIALATGADRKVYVQKTDLWVVPVRGAAPDGPARNLTAGFDGDAALPAWSPDGATLFFHAEVGLSSLVARVARAGGPVTLGLDHLADAQDPVIAPDGKVAWVESQPTKPAEVWVAERAGAEGRPLTSLNAAISKLALGETGSVRWKSTDGVTVEGVLLRPAGSVRAGPMKTLVQLHGGPYGSRYSLGFQPTAQVLAARGYQVFSPNFRSSGGYGTAFLLRQRADWGGQDFRDVMSGVDSLVARRLADPRRLGVYGGSYGGHLSAWAITQTDRFKAAVVMAGGVDFAALLGQSDIKRYRAYEFGGWPWENPESFRRSSPITWIANAKTPTLVMVGENDVRVPYPQSQQLYTALQALGVPSEFVHYPREGHSMREYRHLWDRTTRLAGWMDRWVK